MSPSSSVHRNGRDEFELNIQCSSAISPKRFEISFCRLLLSLQLIAFATNYQPQLTRVRIYVRARSMRLFLCCSSNRATNRHSTVGRCFVAYNYQLSRLKFGIVDFLEVIHVAFTRSFAARGLNGFQCPYSCTRFKLYYNNLSRDGECCAAEDKIPMCDSTDPRTVSIASLVQLAHGGEMGGRKSEMRKILFSVDAVNRP